jgi:hypothetical protein
MRTQFLLPANIVKRLGRGRGIDVGERPLVLIIWLLDVLKYDFCDVDEFMFEGDERTFKLIFTIQVIQKNETDEVDELMFNVGEWS